MLYVQDAVFLDDVAGPTAFSICTWQSGTAGSTAGVNNLSIGTAAGGSVGA